jgi:hypothetical protein
MNANDADAANQRANCSIRTPEGWEDAPRYRLLEIANRHSEWLGEIVRECRLPRPESDKDIVIAVLLAQVNFWRKRSRELDTPENRTRAKRQFAKEAAKLLLSGLWEKTPTKLRSEKRRLGLELDEERWRICLYDWDASSHRGPHLRRALAYSERRFTILAENFGLKLAAPPLKKAGKESNYSRSVAHALLEHRLKTMRAERREEIANAIWIFHNQSFRRQPTLALACALGREPWLKH